MTGLLGKAPLTSDISLFLEIAAIVALFVGRFVFARRRRFEAHGVTAAIATALHAVTVLLVMIPSFAASSNVLFKDLLSPAIIIAWIHAPIGLFVLVLAMYLVSEWRLQPSDPTCHKRARLMRPLWMLWIFNLILGLLLYASIAFAS